MKTNEEQSVVVVSEGDSIPEDIVNQLDPFVREGLKKIPKKLNRDFQEFKINEAKKLCLSNRLNTEEGSKIWFIANKYQISDKFDPKLATWGDYIENEYNRFIVASDG